MMVYIVFSFRGHEQELLVGGVFEHKDDAINAAQAEADLYQNPASVSECALNERLEDSDHWKGAIEWVQPKLTDSGGK